MPTTDQTPPPQQTRPEYVGVLVELLAAFQRIPQKYCLVCKAKICLGIEAHQPGCPLRRAVLLGIIKRLPRSFSLTAREPTEREPGLDIRVRRIHSC